ncbi:DMT family transporter [Amorphus orientalis]|uniref:Drug/metabolite transporter (DMT)-like permease n=1 Tax=Amorphus orientalis TaxID=649198 RepID=A0AAE4ATC6_9HYPH|nr:DMT family transporter [Amorphus orientalis]MDQ0316138.1 drug/metabolite transporter (DMT)-like permease [Amorphus orientalis]
MSAHGTAAATDSGTDTENRASVLIGVAAALATVLAWAGWIVGTRFAATAELPLAWVGLFRFIVPTLVLAPFWIRMGPLPKGVPLWLLALVVVGSGAPFFAVVAAGLQFAPVAEAGVLLPGTMGLWVALLSKLILKERFGRDRVIGLALAAFGVVLIAAPVFLAGHGASGTGRLLLPVGALMWAVYTLAYRRTGLPPLAAAGIACFWSTVMTLPVALWTGVGPLLSHPRDEILIQLFVQGVSSGLIALVGYGIAVSRLGGSRAAAFSSLAPALAALIAIPALGEIPAPIVAVGVAVTVAGVALSSGALRGVVARLVRSGR